MIVSINGENSAIYKERYKEASKDLKNYFKNLYDNYNNIGENEQSILKDFLIKIEPSANVEDLQANNDVINKIINDIYDEENNLYLITTLNSYFCYITDLTKTLKLDKYYVIPLDEEPFKIDANARTIAIPANVKKNGLAVQGDDRAEMVHFEIDRYFDNIDLGSNNIKIYIQYETSYTLPGNAEGEEEFYKKGYVPIAFKDLETKPNKVIFGWLLDKYITKASGNIKFAIHFLQGRLERDILEDITYKLSTLTATSAINKTLPTDNIKIYPVKDPSQLIRDRLVDTELGEAPDATSPYFLNNLGDSAFSYYDLGMEGVEGITYIPSDGESGEKVELNVFASSSDAGHVTYEWKKLDLANNVENDLENVKIELRESEDESILPNKSYYDENGHYIYDLEEYLQDPNHKLYDKKSYCVINKDFTGRYYAFAINRLGTKNKDLSSNIIEIPKPVQPVIIADKNEEYNHILKELDGSFAPFVIMAESGKPYKNDTPDDLTYLWEKINVPESEDNIEEIKAKVKNPDNKEEIIETSDNQYIVSDADGLGWYTVKVIANRNRVKNLLDSEIFYRVTEQPDELEITEEKYRYEPVSFPEEEEYENYYIKEDGKFKKAPEDVEFDYEGDYYIRLTNVKLIDIAKKENIKVAIDLKDKKTDTQLIKWYVDQEALGHDDEAPIEGLVGNEISIKDLTNYVGGYLYCKVFNTYNGKEVAGPSSCRFDINDSSKTF